MSKDERGTQNEHGVLVRFVEAWELFMADDEELHESGLDRLRMVYDEAIELAAVKLHIAGVEKDGE